MITVIIFRWWIMITHFEVMKLEDSRTLLFACVKYFLAVIPNFVSNTYTYKIRCLPCSPIQRCSKVLQSLMLDNMRLNMLYIHYAWVKVVSKQEQVKKKKDFFVKMCLKYSIIFVRIRLNSFQMSIKEFLNVYLMWTTMRVSGEDTKPLTWPSSAGWLRRSLFDLLGMWEKCLILGAAVN